MSRYIDAEVLERKYMSADYMDNDTAYDVIAELDTAPHIDIVRCKECKYAHLTYDGDCKYCEHWKDNDDFLIEVYHSGDHFCSYGERKEP